MAAEAQKVVSFLYTNYRGETGVRRIIPSGIRFTATEWHPVEQWVLDAFDLDRNADRTFTLADIRDWKGGH